MAGVLVVVVAFAIAAPIIYVANAPSRWDTGAFVLLWIIAGIGLATGFWGFTRHFLIWCWRELGGGDWPWDDPEPDEPPAPQDTLDREIAAFQAGADAARSTPRMDIFP